MPVKEYEFFLQVCKDGSIRKAAKTLYISPQGLGKALKNLEHELGVPLFERGKDGIHLTEYGEAVKPYAKKIVDSANAINRSIIQLNQQVSGDLNIACSYGVLGALNPARFSDFETLYPEIVLNVVEGTDWKVQNIVAEQDAFIGISVGPVRKNGLHSRFITSYRLVWLINKNNPLSRKERIEFSDLENERLILYTEEFMAYYNVIECCQKAGFSPNIIYLINEAIMAYKFCKKYNALAITVDFIAEDIAAEEIITKPIYDKNCQWDLYLINRSDIAPSKAQQAFINYLHSIPARGLKQ